MPTTQFDYNATTDGPKLQVQDFIKQPKMVQSLVVGALNKKFIAEGLLRDAGGTPSGVYTYREEEPQYADGFEVVEEYGEIPTTEAKAGAKRAIFTVKGGGAFLISKEMRQRNDIDAVNRRMRQIRNGFTRFWDKRMWDAMKAAQIPTLAASNGAWNNPSSKILYDAGKAKELVHLAASENDDELEYEPDTIVIHTSRVDSFVFNDEIKQFWLHTPNAQRSPYYTGDTLKSLSGLNVWSTPWIPQDQALVLQKKTVGFYGDENPLEATPMYELREKQTWRSDVTRRTGIGIDQPKAAVWIQGI